MPLIEVQLPDELADASHWALPEELT